MVGMAHVAKSLGDQSTAYEAVYYWVMQVISLQTQLAASDFLKQRGSGRALIC
jgi:hypothetical protein